MRELGVIVVAGCVLVGAAAPALEPAPATAPALPPVQAAPEELRGSLERAASPELLGSMARAAGNWILRMQDDSDAHRGRFFYEVDPRSGRLPDGFDEDNFLRQAGTTYSLLLLYETTRDERYLVGAERGVAWALTRLTRDPALPDQAFFEDRGQVKLGGAALPLLSLMKLEQIRGTAVYRETIAQVTRFVLAMQQPDGEFRSMYRYAGSREHPKVEWDSAIYPGEAMLALARRFAMTRDEKLLAAIDHSMDFYRPRQNRSLQQAFIPWTTTAMVELYESTGQKRYADWAIALTDFMVRTQFTDAKLPSFGAFRPRPSANTGAYLEGILDAHRLVARQGDAARRERYRFAALAGYQFLAKLQFDAAAAAAYPAVAEGLVGGFRATPDDPTLRIDNTQHALGALVKGLTMVQAPATAPAAP